LTLPADANTTLPQNLVLPAEVPLGATTNTRQVSLNEMSSDQVCVEMNIIDGAIIGTLFSRPAGDPTFLADCLAAPVAAGNFPSPMGPREALLGVLTTDALGNVTAVPRQWADPITEAPILNSTEVWEIFNNTADAHPIHVHLVGFQVVNRQLLDPAALLLGNLVLTGQPIPPNPNELGYKDTVIVYPGQITRIKAKFDIPGLYVWHCHIVEHEDNEMMRPYVVRKPRLNADFDGDGRTDIAVWRPSDFNWYILNSAGGTPSVVNYGTTGDTPVPGDFDGDGKTDIAVWRNGTWFITNSATGTQSAVPYGTTGDIPVPGDYDGDGKTDMAVWRLGFWFVSNSATGTQSVVNYGTTGDIPVPGDYDGDGKTDIAVWRPSDGNWYVTNSATGTQSVVPYGTAGDKPVPGDYDNDGKNDMAVWRSSDFNWYILNSATGTQRVVNYGTTGDIPVPGDYNTIGTTDIAVWRPSDGNWYITDSVTGTQRVVNWGAPTDLPVKSNQPVQ
ncbi:MAG: FG-GAP-like repeat-containing protein, partial [Desulfuromonadaceae bacterium]